MNDAFAGQTEISLLNPLLSMEELKSFCEEAQRHQCYAVSVPSSRVDAAYHFIGDSEVRVSCVVGFPFGGGDPDAKRYETEVAVDNGAHEIEVVMNLGRFKEQDYAFVLRELRDTVEAADERPVKVLIETGLWSETELTEACRVVLDSGAQFISTSTGMNGRVAGVREIAILREMVGSSFGIKASGLAGLEGGEGLLEAGANRLGDAGLRTLSVL